MREIGSNFWENKIKEKSDINFIEKEFDGLFNNYFKSGRNAIKALAHYLKEHKDCKTILLPMYTCSTVIDPFTDEDWTVHFFDINEDLSPNIGDLEIKTEMYRPDAVLFHSYFGFDTFSQIYYLLKEFQKKGILVIEDITQSLFSSFLRFQADYYVASLRKFFCISDGGILVSKEKIKIDFLNEDDELVITNDEACCLKKKYMNNEIDDKNTFRILYQKMNAIFSDNSEIRKMSHEARNTIKYLDYDFIKNTRISNYLYLKEKINKIKWLHLIFDECHSNEIPLYMPIYVDSNLRTTIQKKLAENNIYCPIIWPQPANVECDLFHSKKIYDSILCIPVDQRYSNDDMEYIVKVLTEMESLV